MQSQDSSGKRTGITPVSSFVLWRTICYCASLCCSVKESSNNDRLADFQYYSRRPCSADTDTEKKSTS
ncbi:hypothetical protein TNCV_2439391 [Trichonephila clavipes]|nr:hypothetical protein TNCV_2439391 [Trichonephila clavipes]